jgi:hypothetical protein
MRIRPSFLLLLVENYSMTTSNMLSRVGESLKLDISYEICIMRYVFLIAMALYRLL